MTTHIVWAIIWFLIMLASFYGGAVIAWISGIAATVLPDRAPTVKSVGGALAFGALVLVLAWAFAAFSLIKMVLQIVAAFQS